MSVKLFNDDAGETLTEAGGVWAKDIGEILKPLMQKATKENICLRDLTTLVVEEISLVAAETRLINGINFRKAQREREEMEKGKTLDSKVKNF